MRTAIFVFSALVLGGCGASRLDSEVTPVIAVSPGLSARLALMDAYRLNDSREVRVMAADGTPLVGDGTEADAPFTTDPLSRSQVIEAPVAPPR